MPMMNLDNETPARWHVRMATWLVARRGVGPVVLRMPWVRRTLVQYRETDFPRRKLG